MSNQKNTDVLSIFLRSGVTGFALSALLMALLVGLGVFGLGLWHGVLAWMGFGLVFAGVQYMFLTLDQDDDDDDQGGGLRARVFLAEPVPIRVDRKRQRR